MSRPCRGSRDRRRSDSADAAVNGASAPDFAGRRAVAQERSDPARLGVGAAVVGGAALGPILHSSAGPRRSISLKRTESSSDDRASGVAGGGGGGRAPASADASMMAQPELRAAGANVTARSRL